ncbi:glycosyltransferase [Mangrovihabitans endophyticus]|uniref:Glycosyl transferase n=1 Tax=Mangrovihabitans endophyticus TaxID=1751298 RepID=A0A8J3C8D0_9ACTN|nr:glycosyltransferase [Mangrovihabitans endophyticus]GGL19549.1 glycosyl transferase [Mangrovihabitans endophyticus]
MDPAARGVAAAQLMTGLLADRSVAVVHEWFSAVGGSENMFTEIAALVPHAVRHVLWVEPGVDAPELRQTWLAHTPLCRSKALALPVMPLVWRTAGRPAPDVVISSSHAFAHTVKFGPPQRTRHVSYVHTPARYVWSPGFDSRGANPLLRPVRRLLQEADVRGGRHVHAYAANSLEVRDRIRRFWHRDAEVIHPPVDVEFYGAAPLGHSRDYLLGVGRWIPYKRFDLMIEIAEAAGRPLVLAGSGPCEAALRRRAGGAVRFEPQPSRDRLRELYAGAAALLYPAHEDFGIVPVEAQACGTPVLGLRRGGLRETVVEGETGFLVDATDPAAYARLVPRLSELDPQRIRRHAAGFGRARFRERMSQWVRDVTG